MPVQIPPRFLLLIMLLALIAGCVQPARILHNGGGVLALRALLQSQNRPPLQTVQRWLDNAVRAGRPEADWTLGMLAARVGDETVRRAAQSRLLDATPARLDLLSVAAIDDPVLAAQATQLYPDRPLSLTWRAIHLEETDPEQAITLYRQALALNPLPYDWWLGLGRAYEQMGDNQAALDAYMEGCDLATGVIACHEVTALKNKMQAP